MPITRTFWLSQEVAARDRGMAVQAVEVQEGGELAAAFARMVKDRAQAIQIIGGPFIYSVRGQIAELAVRHRLPTAYPSREGPEASGLLSYGANLLEAWPRAAVYLDKILEGSKPADLPHRATHEIGAGHQPEDREGPRLHDPAVTPAAGRSGDRMMDRRVFMALISGAFLAAPIAAQVFTL